MDHMTPEPQADAAAEGAGPASDGASAQSSSVAADLVLSFTTDGQITLQTVTSQGNRELGTFDDVRDAWDAIDRIDVKRLEERLAVERAVSVEIPENRRAA